ncbi:hypothetical protein CI610_02221 [invertebrate metagenome]|uniref:Lipo-like protein n=1 Tax=invertebrate metagenome TaxID=1711999 RepID=A0A2H9T6H8_9ZZZZ
MPLFASLSRVLTRWLIHNTQKLSYPLCDFERIRYELKPADVVLVEGRSRVSQVIKQVTLSSWSHTFLYIGRLHDISDSSVRDIIRQHYQGEDDEQLIIESELGCGTRICPLSRYKTEHLRICRPKGLRYSDGQQVIHYAVSCLGQPYNVRQILDLLRFFIPYVFIPGRWRSSLFQYSPGKETKTVCSTMLAEAFATIQFPILPLVKYGDKATNIQLFQRNPKLCTPRDFDYSPYFEIIKYPFLDYNRYADYKLLPWRGQNELEGCEAEDYLSVQAMKKLEQLFHENPTDY